MRHERLSIRTSLLLLFSLPLIAHGSPANGQSANACNSAFSRIESQRLLTSRDIWSWSVIDVADGKYDKQLEHIFDHYPPDMIAELLKPRLKSRIFREAVDRWMTRDFQRQTETLWRTKLGGAPYLLVGGGPHTAALVVNLDKAIRDKTVVVESDVIGSTFYQRDFRMNSAQDVRANEIPGAALQLKDYLDEDGPPLAHDFGVYVRLVFRMSGVRVMEGISYKPERTYVRMTGAKENPRAQIATTLVDEKRKFELPVQLDRIGLATGMDSKKLTTLVPDEDLYSEPADLTELKTFLEKSKHAQSFEETSGIMSGPDASRIMFQIKNQLGRTSASKLSGGRIAIVGHKHTAFTLAESLSDLANIQLSSNHPIKITMFGLKAQNSAEFRTYIVPPGGSQEFKQMIVDRYTSGPIPNALDTKLLVGNPSRAMGIVPSYDRSKPHQVITADGSTLEFDYIVICTGPNYSQGAGNLTISNLRDQTVGRRWTQQIGPTSDPYGQAYFYTDAYQQRLLFFNFGVNAQLPISPERLKGPIGNRDSLYVTLVNTQRLARELNRLEK